MERMVWLAELYDRMSGPARRMTSNLTRLFAVANTGRAQLGGLSQGVDGASAAMRQGGTSVAGFAGSWGLLTGAVAAAGAAFAATGYAIGKAAFTNFAFKESALATGRALWGSAEAAQAMFKQASDLARLTPFNVGEVVTAFNKLGAAGFGAKEVPVVFQGLADIASMSGRGAESIGMMTLAFSQIMGRGRLASQELNQITEAAGGAVSRLKLFKEIAGIMGVAETSIESMMEQGLIPARTAIMGVMQVAKGLGGGVIGAVSIEQSKTLAGLWSNFEDTITNLWLTMDLGNAPWFAAVKSVLGNVVTLLDSSTASGRRLQMVFERVFANTIGLLGDFAGPKGLERMIGVLDQVGRAFEVVWDIGLSAFQGLWDGVSSVAGPFTELILGMGKGADTARGMHDAFEILGKVIGYLGVGFAAVEPVLSLVLRTLRETLGVVEALVGAVGGLLGGAFGNLMSGNLFNLDAWRDLGMGVGEQLDEGFRNALQIHSPSRVFEAHGENVVKGFNAGVESIPGMDADLAGNLAAGAESGGGSHGAGPGAVSVALTVNVDNSGHADGDSIAQRLSEILPSTIASIFNRMATEQGVG